MGLETIPLEVLEHIALFAAMVKLEGPPSDLAALCSTSTVIHRSLSLSSNPQLYASVFRLKFDTAAPLRRLAPEDLTVENIAAELQRRFEALQRLRGKVGSHALLSNSSCREHDLWVAIILMLENDGKNAVQLKRFGGIWEWLHTYLLETTGGSYIQQDVMLRSWPRDNVANRLVLWLLCLCDADGTSISPPSKSYTDILRAYTVNANKYPLTQSSWIPSSQPSTTQISLRPEYRYFGHPISAAPPATAISAILGYITRVKIALKLVWSSTPASHLAEHREAWDWGAINGSFSQRWDSDWERCIGPRTNDPFINGMQRFYRAGTLEGVWEGIFTFAEFRIYAGVLAGDPPQAVTDSAIGSNLQIWKLREYDLFTSELTDSDILPHGDAYNAFFPATTVEERIDSVVLTHHSKESVYRRAVPPVSIPGGESRGLLQDVILLGEGHSSWGDFMLRGRVRASDAFVSVLKEYIGQAERGRWLYRGYLIGGRFVGRWRDVMTPMDTIGYEGGFELIHRS
ncbi:hypothetical protein K439DRAFT_1412011 [Ramaria rubella]|nr:hypothetical protein K439DRAFT_1412011 [Ramaria rubella]